MQRIRSIDLARGFTVLFIAPIHAVLLFSKPYVYNTVFGQFLAFIAEGPGGQLFMLLMGISFVLSKHQDFSSVLKKSLLMLLLGYVLNFLKFVLPAVLNVLPTGVYKELQVSRDVYGYIQMLLTGDILQFAGIAMLIIYFVTRLPRYPLWAMALAMAICFVSPVLFDKHSDNVVPNYLLQLIGGQPPRVFFPLFPWLVYPLIGLVIGHAIKQEKPLVFGYCLIIGFALMFISCAPWMPYAKMFFVSFYRTYPSGTLYHTGIVLIWLYLMHWIDVNGRRQLFFKFFALLSRHITIIYFVQWIIICWSLPLIGFRTLGLFSSMLVAALFCLWAPLIGAIILLVFQAQRRLR